MHLQQKRFPLMKRAGWRENEEERKEEERQDSDAREISKKKF